MRKARFSVFTVLAMVLAPCMFNESGLESGAGAAVAAEPETANAEPETALEAVESGEQASEASEGTENAAAGQETQNGPGEPADV